MSDPYWGNSEEPEFNPEYRRKRRGRYGAGDDEITGADAEDFYDDGTNYDLDFEDHAAGVNRDSLYERSYSDRQGNDDDFTLGSSSGLGSTPSTPTPRGQTGLPTRAEQLRNRFDRRHQLHEEKHTGEGSWRERQSQGGGIDSLFDATPGLSWLPCSNSVLLMLVATIGLLSCLVLAVLAAGSLQRLLGI